MFIIPPPTHNEVLPLSLSIMICLLMTRSVSFRCKISAHDNRDFSAQLSKKAHLSNHSMLTCSVKLTRSTTISTQKSPRKPGLAIELSGATHESTPEEHVLPRMSFSCRKMKGCKQPLKASETKHWKVYTCHDHSNVHFEWENGSGINKSAL